MFSSKQFFLAACLPLLLIGCSGGNHRTNSSGTLEATETDVASTLPGRVVEVRAALGASVAAGDTLVVLDTELLRLQRAQAEASRGSILAQRRVTAESLAQAERNLEFLKTTLERTQTLTAQGSAMQSQLDEVQAKYDLAVIQRTAAQRQLEVLSAEETKLDAALAVVDRQLQEGVLIAPTAGEILLRAVEPGEVVQPGQACLKIGDLARMELKVYLSETDIDLVKVGGKLPVLVDALNGESLEGVVSWISSEAEFTPKNAQTRDARTQLVYAIKLRIPNPDGRLHIGMPAELELGKR